MNYYMRKGKVLVVGWAPDGLALRVLSPIANKKTRAPDIGVSTAMLRVGAGQGLGIRTPQTVLKTAGPASMTVHQRPMEFDRSAHRFHSRPHSSAVVWHVGCHLGCRIASPETPKVPGLAEAPPVPPSRLPGGVAVEGHRY
jgi:hypothetical protein